MYRNMFVFLLLIAASSSAFSENGRKVVTFSDNKLVCDEVAKGLEAEKTFAKPNENRERKVFVGESRLKYNPDDYYLWVSSFDFSNDGVEDLLAIDWSQRSKNLYYLAVYVFLGSGEIYKDRRNLKQLLLGKKLLSQHGEGTMPIVPEQFLLQDKDGRLVDKSFVGFHKIEPISIEGKNYLLAKNDISKEAKHLVFGWQKKVGSVEVVCEF